jgi:predicted DNA-binding protein
MRVSNSKKRARVTQGYQISFRVSDEIRDRLVKLADEDRRSVAAVVRNIVEGSVSKRARAAA